MKEGRYVVFILPKYLKDKMKALDVNRRGRADLRGGARFKMTPRQWWEYAIVEYAMVNPRVCTRLEQLMGTNLVRITDRAYMKMLQQRIQEDYTSQQDEVMAQRMHDEIEREKSLVLEGKMKVEEASQELLEHPVFKASQLTKQLIERRVSAIRKEYLPRCKGYYGPETEEEKEEEVVLPEEPVEIEEDELAREKKKLLQEVDDITDEYMFSQKDYERLKYESPLVKKLKQLQSVEEIYEMAERIVGTFEGPEDEPIGSEGTEGEDEEGTEEDENTDAT